MKIDTLDALLQQREDAYNRVLPKSYETEKPSYPPTTAVKSATLDSFMEMISMLVAKTMKKTKTEFVPDEGARIEMDMSVPIDHPYIYYEVISRKPKSELKPRPREEIHEMTADDGSRRQGRVWGQKFECHVQFHIAASDYKQANKVMNDFESLIFNYTAFFKKNGVAEILFEKHFTDRNLDPFRQSLSIRSLQYYVEIERLFTEFVASDIEKVSIG